MSNFRYLLLDCETTGVGKLDKMIELAWIEVDANLEPIDEFHSYIDPQIPISPGASGVHGITNADVADAPTVEELFSIVLPGKVSGNVVMVAHNAPFDRRFVAPWFDNLVGAIDSLRLARRYFPDAENHKLATLKFALGLGREQAHSAMGDVRTLYALMRKISEVSGMSLEEMRHDSYQPLYVAKMPFGKHKGMPLDLVPTDYLRWLESKGDIDPDLKWSVERVLKVAA